MLVDLRAAANKIVQRRVHRAEFQKVFDDAQVDRGHAADFGKLKLVGRRRCRLTPRSPRRAEKIGKFPFQNPRMPAQNDVDAIGQRFAETLEGFSSEDDDIAFGHFLEPLEILRQMPWDLAAASDDTVF